MNIILTAVYIIFASAIIIIFGNWFICRFLPRRLIIKSMNVLWAIVIAGIISYLIFFSEPIIKRFFAPAIDNWAFLGLVLLGVMLIVIIIIKSPRKL